MTDPGNASDESDKATPGTGTPPAGDTGKVDLGKKNEADTPPQFGSPFDYDATAEASLSQPPATSEATPSPGSAGTGPGWDTYSGVGNGPGWGSTPTYPSPSGIEPTAPLPNAGWDQQQQPGEAPVYGAPDPNYGASYGGAPQSGQEYQGQGYQQSGYQQSGYPPQGYAQQGYQQPGYPGYQPAGYNAYGDPSAPFGRHPVTGEPYSDKSKLTAGLLQIFLGGFGVGRFYLNQPGIAVAQIAVTWLTCGIGGLWPLIDGIMMLTGSVKDQYGRPLREQ